MNKRNQRAIWYGTVYLLHFSEPFYHAQHYVGFTATHNAEARLSEHLDGLGSPLVRAVASRGIVVVVAREWGNQTRDFERRLKQAKNTRRFCPKCRNSDHARQPRLIVP